MRDALLSLGASRASACFALEAECDGARDTQGRCTTRLAFRAEFLALRCELGRPRSLRVRLDARSDPSLSLLGLLAQQGCAVCVARRNPSSDTVRAKLSTRRPGASEQHVCALTRRSIRMRMTGQLRSSTRSRSAMQAGCTSRLSVIEKARGMCGFSPDSRAFCPRGSVRGSFTNSPAKLQRWVRS